MRSPLIHRCRAVLAGLGLAALLALAGSARGGDLVVEPGKKSLGQALAEARTGSTIVLPAGTFEGGFVLPDGVSLRGAGYRRTTIDGGTRPAGIALRGSGQRVEDLTVRTRGNAALVAEKARGVEVRRVRLLGGALGIRWQEVTGSRIENTVIAGSLIGVSLQRVREVAVVHCTVAGTSSMGLSLTDAEETTVFNNLVTDAGTGILVGGSRRGLAVDHNLYRALVVGKLEGQAARVSLGPWRDVSGGLDTHSLALAVNYVNAEEGDFRPTSVLDWNPARLTTSGWGVQKLAGVRAPGEDIEGAKRSNAPDLGAYEAPTLNAADADGTFEVAEDEGTKSAGIFHPDGTLVRYLFHDLPLKKGTYPFHLPARTQLGAAVEPGPYELRLVESRLGWTYRGITGNNGVDSRREDTDQAHTDQVRFGRDGDLLLGNGWNERHENVRSRNLKTGKANWIFPGAADLRGLCVAPDGTVYCARESGTKDILSFARLDGRTGQPIAWEDEAHGRPTLPGAVLNGLEELDGSLYFADAGNSKVYYADANRPIFEHSFACPSPGHPAADRKRKVLWLISGKEKLLAFSPERERLTEFTGVASPVGLAVAGDRLAVASAATGKIHFFDCSDPKNLKATHSVGRGDGPYGPLKPDRFHFQTGPSAPPRAVSLALDEAGRLALCDASGRVVVLGTSGEPVYASMAHFGNKPTLATGTGSRQQVFDSSGRWSWWVDAKAGTWEPDAWWGLPPAEGGGNPFIGTFAAEGRQFAVLHHSWTDSIRKQRHGAMLIVRYENHLGRPVLLYTPGKDGWVVRRDTNSDGVIDEKDGEGEPVRDTEGKPLRWQMAARWVYLDSRGNGDFRSMSPIGADGLGFVWKFTGLDREGVPIYTFPTDGRIRVQQPTLPSAYNYARTEDARSQSESLRTADGRFLVTFQFHNGPNGMGLSNSGAQDLARYNPDGSLRWLKPLNDYGPVQGIKALGRSAYLTSWGHQAEWIGLDEDGLSLGHLGFPVAAHWTGMWVDHPDQYCTFRGNDGKWQVLCGDYMVNATHWLTVEHEEDYRKVSFPFTVTATRARQLAFRLAEPTKVLGRPSPPKVVVRKLPRPLPIDGDLKKWRDVGVTPQVLILPVTASGSIDGPADASAVVRLAYEGQNLYVQVLRFDDVVTFHQPAGKSHQQDTFEIMINGFSEGFQWSVSRFTDTGPALVRRRFFANHLQDLTPAEHAPRVVKVLENAKDVSERSLIEAAYGVDLSGCKVIVTEFKLPIDRVSYRGSEGALFPVRSGSSFWLGMMIDDNDVPGADVQDLLVWPASYGTFNPKEDGALAVFE